MQKNKIKTIYQIKTLFIVLIIFCSFAVLNTSFAQSFIGPSCAAGQCQGKIGVDSSGNVSMGTSTPQSGTKTLIISQTSDSSTYGLRVLSSNNSPLLLVRSDGKVSIATSGANYALTVSGDIYSSGNLILGGSLSSALSAGNVTPGVFNSLQGGGTGAYAFLGSLGIATSSQVGLPQSLSVYGGGYFSGNVGIGTTAPSTLLHVNAPSGSEKGIYWQDGSNTDLVIYRDINVGNWSLLRSNMGNGIAIIGQPDVVALAVSRTSGNVGIGTTSPAYKLDVVGQINSSGGLCIAGDCKTSWSQVGGSSQWINTTGGIYYLGNVGIGTSTVSYPLFVSTSTDTLFAIQRTGASSPTIFKQGTDSGFIINNAGSDVLTIKSGNIGIGTTTPVYNLDVNGIVNATDFYKNGAPFSGSSQWTDTTGGIYYLNNVGIGTSSPSRRLDVRRSASDAIAFTLRNTGSDNIGMNFANPSGSIGYLTLLAQMGVSVQITTSNSLPIDLRPNGTQTMRLTTAGNVGIGTTTPAYKLEVIGQINSSGGLCIAGDCKTSWSQVGGSQWTDTTGGIYYLGNVGIGTSTVSYPLFVSTSTDTLFAIQRTGASSPTIFKQGIDSGFVINNAGSDILTIKSGNIGIGTTTPQRNLHLFSSTAGNAILRVEEPAPRIEWLETDAGVDNKLWRIIANSNNLLFEAVKDDLSASNSFLKIDRGSGISVSYVTIPTGNVGIGTTSPAYKLEVVGNIRTSGCLVYNGGTLGTCASDIRLKDNIMNLTFDNAIEKVIKLQPKKFVFKQDPNQEMHGLIAQEVEEFAPELITTDQNGYKQIKYGDVQWLTVEAIKDLNNRVIQLEEENQILKQEIQKLKNKLN
jgi:hypothetical protein